MHYGLHKWMPFTMQLLLSNASHVVACAMHFKQLALYIVSGHSFFFFKNIMAYAVCQVAYVPFKATYIHTALSSPLPPIRRQS